MRLVAWNLIHVSKTHSSPTAKCHHSINAQDTRDIYSQNAPREAPYPWVKNWMVHIMPMWNTLKQKVNFTHDLKLWNIENNQHVAFPAGLCWIVDIVPQTDHARRLEAQTGRCWHISLYILSNVNMVVVFFFSPKDQGENYKHNINWKPLPFRSTTKFQGIFKKLNLKPPTKPGCESHRLPNHPLFLFDVFVVAKPKNLLRSLRWGWVHIGNSEIPHITWV